MFYPSWLSYVLPLVVAFFTLIPPIDFRIPAPTSYWPLLMVVAGLAGIRILFIRTTFIVKIVALTSFVSCFFSHVPYLSFNAYPSIVFCCYLYILLTRMDSWRPMFTMLKTILILNTILLSVQMLGQDRLLNFGLNNITTYGIVGHHMQMGSFSLVLGALLSIIHPAFWLFPVVVGTICNSAWTLLCAGVAFLLLSKPKLARSMAVICAVGFIAICISSGKIQQGLSKDTGRLVVWQKTVQLLNKKPWTGWGPATYKTLFPAFSEMRSIPYKTAHNDPLQFAFELGYPLTLVYFCLWLWLFLFLRGLRHTKRGRHLWIAYIVISLDMQVHFPARMIQCVPLMIVFLAYCETQTMKAYRPFPNDREEILAKP